MRFAELLEKYKNQTASEEERRLVEEEFEKNELINEYLSEKLLDCPPLEEVNLEAENREQTREIRRINRSVNLRMIKLICMILALLLAAAATVYYVALPAYDARFYNPLAAVEGVADLREGHEEAYSYYDDFSPLYLSARAFTELHCPGWTLFDAQAESLGLGSYEVCFRSMHPFREQQNFSCKLEKGEQKQSLDRDWFFYPGSTGQYYDRGSKEVQYVQDDGSVTYAQSEESRAAYRDALPGLPESVQVSAYVSFEQDLTVEELLALEESMDIGNCEFRWLAVRSGESDYFQTLGFSTNSSGLVLEMNDEFDRQFPAFQEDSHLLSQGMNDEKAAHLEEHFCSLLRYISYQKDFLNAFCRVNRYDDVSVYEEALDYIESHGVKVFGAYVIGDRDGMIALEQREEIHSFQLEDVKLSLYVNES